MIRLIKFLFLVLFTALISSCSDPSQKNIVEFDKADLKETYYENDELVFECTLSKDSLRNGTATLYSSNENLIVESYWDSGNQNIKRIKLFNTEKKVLANPEVTVIGDSVININNDVTFHIKVDEGSYSSVKMYFLCDYKDDYSFQNTHAFKRYKNGKCKAQIKVDESTGYGLVRFKVVKEEEITTGIVELDYGYNVKQYLPFTIRVKGKLPE